jgi:hypothetical protein
MSRRFEGAITTPDEVLDSSILPAPQRPPRPASIEASAAILIVGGLLATVGTVASAFGMAAAAGPGAGPIISFIVALNLLTVVVGLLVRSGRYWVLCLNIVAVLLFVELTAVPGGSGTAALLALLDAFVFVALMRNRAWFEWRPPGEHAAR